MTVRSELRSAGGSSTIYIKLLNNLDASSPLVEQFPEEVQADEVVDCQVIELLRDEILPYCHTIPKDFILKVVVLLNKGSIHSASGLTSLEPYGSRQSSDESGFDVVGPSTKSKRINKKPNPRTSAPTLEQEMAAFASVMVTACSLSNVWTTYKQNDGETEQKLREEFAKTCFETLLQFSLLHGLDTGEWFENAKCFQRALKIWDHVKFLKEAKLSKTKPVETLKRAACDLFLKCKLAFSKTIADECQPFLQRFQT
uniref:Mon2 C-terminal domain-containing protein n=1 Tax=Timema monikensis TaxID=170555 RepID=A0A7R9EIM9_9NEOP|nr:unnamed protein product [Timema monikensis]